MTRLTTLALLLALSGPATPRPAQEPVRNVGVGETLALAGVPHLLHASATVDSTALEWAAPQSGGPPSSTLGPAALSLRGTATWYCGNGSACTKGYGPQDLVAAIDPTTGIAKGTRVTVSHDGRSVTVRVVDVCACAGRRVIDLTRGAFSRLASPSRGVIAVTIRAAGPPIRLPDTSTEGSAP